MAMGRVSVAIFTAATFVFAVPPAVVPGDPQHAVVADDLRAVVPGAPVVAAPPVVVVASTAAQHNDVVVSPLEVVVALRVATLSE
jgi:hypothetical protein